MKTCNRCKKEKQLTEFFKDKNNKTDGHYSMCKECKQNSTLSWRMDNREKYNAVHRKYCKDNYQKLRLQRYKLTPESYAEMLLKQEGVCAICKKLPKGKRPLCVDHEHSTGKVRGILCYGCNRALHILDSPVLLQKAQDYLQSSN